MQMAWVAGHNSIPAKNGIRIVLPWKAEVTWGILRI